MSTTPDVLLATCAEWPNGEPGAELLTAALAAQGLSSAWAAWDDPFVDWGAARMVAIRSTWDYDTRLPDFLGWASTVGATMLHDVELLRWNTDKSYLAELAALGTLPVVPTAVVDSQVDLRAAVGRFGASVVKPRVGCQGRGIVIVYDAETWLPVDAGPWVVQPLLSSVHHEGEVSVFVVGGQPVSQVNRVAGRTDIRVHPQFGGRAHAVDLSYEAAILAVDAVAASTEILGSAITYARVDMLRSEGQLMVSEVELTEPALFLDLVPANAERFAAAVAAKL